MADETPPPEEEQPEEGQPDEQPVGLKDEFYNRANFSDLPEGILSFLEVALPEAPQIATPADVENAIIAQGVLSKYLLDLFGSFKGFTPIPLFLRIGQHNPVIQSMFLAGTEYVKSSPIFYDFAIIKPEGGQVLTDPNVVFTVQILKGIEKISEVTLKIIEDERELSLEQGEENSDRFTGTLRCPADGDTGIYTFTAEFTVKFGVIQRSRKIEFSVELLG